MGVHAMLTRPVNWTTMEALMCYKGAIRSFVGGTLSFPTLAYGCGATSHDGLSRLRC